jgi:hypothetical protein
VIWSGRGAVAQNGGPSGEPDTDLRRRAAWLLGMLAIVAVLLVVVMSQVVGTGGGSKGNTGPRDLDSAVGAKPSSSSPSSVRSSHRPAASSPPRAQSSPPGSGSNSPVHGKRCPTKQVCTLDGDPGGGIAAINDYRTQHGKDAVAGTVSSAAQTCALHNGSGCSGGWAETELAKPDGAAAVQKILPFAHLLSDMKNFEIGWAYDPGAKLYYFAIIRNG